MTVVTALFANIEPVFVHYLLWLNRVCYQLPIASYHPMTVHDFEGVLSSFIILLDLIYGQFTCCISKVIHQNYDLALLQVVRYHRFVLLLAWSIPNAKGNLSLTNTYDALVELESQGWRDLTVVFLWGEEGMQEMSLSWRRRTNNTCFDSFSITWHRNRIYIIINDLHLVAR